MALSSTVHGSYDPGVLQVSAENNTNINKHDNRANQITRHATIKKEAVASLVLTASWRATRVSLLLWRVQWAERRQSTAAGYGLE